MDPFDVLQTQATSALVSDALDALGMREQCLDHEIAPLVAGSRMVGRAFPVTATPVEVGPDERYVQLLESLDSVGRGQVFVLGTGRSDRAAAWGELVSNACAARGAAGTLTDGLVRDSAKIRMLDYPVFARGTKPSDIHGRLEVVAVGKDVHLGRVIVREEDVVVADDDGAVIVPASVTGDIAEILLAKKQGEDSFRDAVRQGALPSEAYRKFGVL